MRSAVILMVLLVGCSPSSTADGDPLVRLAPAKATATEFQEIYKAVCLSHFPKRKGMRAQALKRGFKLIRRDRTGIVGEPVDFEFYQNDTLKLSLEFGNSSLFWDGIDGGGLVAFEACNLHGHLVDPEKLTAVSVQSAYQVEITFSADDDNKKLRGNLKDARHKGRFTFRLPYLYSVEAESNIKGANRCGTLAACRVRQEARFELMITEDGAPF